MVLATFPIRSCYRKAAIQGCLQFSSPGRRDCYTKLNVAASIWSLCSELTQILSSSSKINGSLHKVLFGWSIVKYWHEFLILWKKTILESIKYLQPAVSSASLEEGSPLAHECSLALGDRWWRVIKKIPKNWKAGTEHDAPFLCRATVSLRQRKQTHAVVSFYQLPSITALQFT